MRFLWICSPQASGRGRIFKERKNIMEKKKEVPIWEKACMTIEEAAAYSSIGINKIDELAKMPRCPFVLYVGRKKLIKRREFERFISENIEL
jgi:excisionase family DNA binding protein